MSWWPHHSTRYRGSRIAGLVGFDRDARDLAGDHHRVRVRADDAVTVNHVLARDVERDGAVRGDFDRAGEVRELHRDHVDFVLVFTDLLDPGVGEPRMIAEVFGVDGRR